MPKYRVTVEQTQTLIYEIEAKNSQIAEEVIREDGSSEHADSENWDEKHITVEEVTE